MRCTQFRQYNDTTTGDRSAHNHPFVRCEVLLLLLLLLSSASSASWTITIFHCHLLNEQQQPLEHRGSADETEMEYIDNVKDPPMMMDIGENCFVLIAGRPCRAKCCTLSLSSSRSASHLAHLGEATMERLKAPAHSCQLGQEVFRKAFYRRQYRLQWGKTIGLEIYHLLLHPLNGKI